MTIQTFVRIIDANRKEHIFQHAVKQRYSQTEELNDWQTLMCNQTALQQNIAGITKDGYDIALFLADTMRGETPGVKVCHRMDAAKHLIKYGFTDTDCETTSDRLSRAGGNPVEEEQGGDETPVQSPLSLGRRLG